MDDREVQHDIEPDALTMLSPRAEQRIRRQILRKLIRYFAAEEAGEPEPTAEDFESTQEECCPFTLERAL